MSIYPIGFGVVLLLIQAYSASQKEAENKIKLWKALLMSALWFLTVPFYLLAKSDLGGVSKSIKKLFNMPIA